MRTFLIVYLCSLACIALSYVVRKRGTLTARMYTRSVKYTVWVWRIIYDAKDLLIPDKGDPVFHILKVGYRLLIGALFLLSGPLLFLALCADVLAMFVTLPRLKQEYVAEKKWPPLPAHLRNTGEGQSEGHEA